jgi:hypothetical protein
MEDAITGRDKGLNPEKFTRSEDAALKIELLSDWNTERLIGTWGDCRFVFEPATNL